MRIALIGATGFIGSRLLAELVRRGHRVTAIARNPAKVPAGPGVSAKAADIHEEEGLAAALAGHDAVISSVHFSASDPLKLLSAVKRSGAARYLVVGGAGSLEVAPGLKLYDTDDFPAQYRDEAKRGGAYLERLEGEGELDWTFLSPAALIEPGERTGRFRLGRDQLLLDGAGQSRISAEDYAVAMIDELERPAHRRQRFTVAY